jgi:hypothetical protein
MMRPLHSVALPLVLCAVMVTGCKSRKSLSDEELDYVQTSIEILHVKATLPAGTDSNAVRAALAPVYKKHQTSEAQYKKQTRGFAEDPARAAVLIKAIRDSVGMQ